MDYMFAIRENLIKFIKNYPVTILIFIVSSIIAIGIILFFESYKNAIIVFGGLDKELIEKGEIWRFLTYAFGHMSLFHFLLNMPLILILSRPLERYYGSIFFSLIYMALSISSGIFIYYFYQGSYPLAGSSGAGYGLIGMFTFFVLKYPNKISSYDKRFILILLVLGIIFTLYTPDISISGHLGGFISGFVLAFFISILNKNQNKVSFYHI